MKKYIILLALGALAFGACKKKKITPTPPTVYTEENPLQGFLTQSGFNQKNNVSTWSSFYEEGFNFKINVTGKITALVVKLPVVNNNLRVTIWDSTAGTPIRTENVNVTAANTEITFPISEIPLTIGKMYTITFFTKDDFSRYRTDGTTAKFPFTIGNIIITTVSTSDSRTAGLQIYPEYALTHAYYGDLSFKFIQTQ